MYAVPVKHVSGTGLVNRSVNTGRQSVNRSISSSVRFRLFGDLKVTGLSDVDVKLSKKGFTLSG